MEYVLLIKPDAEFDIKECIKWYEKKKEGLGLYFLSDLDHKMNLIQSNPLLYQVRYKTIRMAFLNVFQEAIHFTVERNIIYIHAVLSTQRDPKLWDKEKGHSI